MKTMVERQSVIHMYRVCGFSKRYISRELHISRNTVNSILAEYESALSAYNSEESLSDLLTIQPKYDTSKRCYRKLTTEIRDEIGLCLKKNAAKISMGLRKQCMLKKDNDISYPSVCNYIRKMNSKRGNRGNEAFIRLYYKPGALTYSLAWQKIPSEIRKLYDTHFKNDNRAFVLLLKYANENGFLWQHIVKVSNELIRRGVRKVSAKQIKAMLHGCENVPDDRLSLTTSRQEENIEKEAALPGLETLEFIVEGRNVVLYGNPSTSKTHMATVLGIKACMKDYSVLFTSVPILFTKIREAKFSKTFHSLQLKFEKYDLVICDEFGYVSCDKEGGELLFNHLSLRAGKKSTIITTNLAFNRWNEIIEDKVLVAAMVDRMTHKAYLINMSGQSYRFKETQKMCEKNRVVV